MPYNISSSSVKKCDLRIPLKELRRYGEESKEQLPDGVTEYHFSFAEDAEIIGVRDQKKGWLEVCSFCWCGERSGGAFDDALLPILSKSKGSLEAILIWGGGPEITRLIASDGVVSHEVVEL